MQGHVQGELQNHGQIQSQGSFVVSGSSSYTGLHIIILDFQKNLLSRKKPFLDVVGKRGFSNIPNLIITRDVEIFSSSAELNGLIDKGYSIKVIIVCVI